MNSMVTATVPASPRLVLSGIDWRTYTRLLRSFAECRSIRLTYDRGELEIMSPLPEHESDADMLGYFRAEAGSIYHLCGSCAMGPDPGTAVVSSRLKVHGIDNLRIVDASIFPNITSGNINAPTMMVAEKGAAMILEDAGQW